MMLYVTIAEWRTFQRHNRRMLGIQRNGNAQREGRGMKDCDRRTVLYTSATSGLAPTSKVLGGEDHQRCQRVEPRSSPWSAADKANAAALLPERDE